MVLVSILCCKWHYWNLIKDHNWIMTKDTFCLRSFTLHMMKREDVNSALFGANAKSNSEAWSHGLFHRKQTTGICHSAQYLPAPVPPVRCYITSEHCVGEHVCVYWHRHKLQRRGHIHKLVDFVVLFADHSSSAFRPMCMHAFSHSFIYSFMLK